MFTWLKNLFNSLVQAFKKFIDAALPVVTQAILAELKDFAVSVVGELEYKNLDNKDKRKEAFQKIKDEAVKRGKDISDSLVNLLLEIALQYIKNS